MIEMKFFLVWIIANIIIDEGDCNANICCRKIVHLWRAFSFSFFFLLKKLVCNENSFWKDFSMKNIWNKKRITPYGVWKIGRNQLHKDYNSNVCILLTVVENGKQIAVLIKDYRIANYQNSTKLPLKIPFILLELLYSLLIIVLHSTKIFPKVWLSMKFVRRMI